ncbi:MAG: WS/DGAT domain-containing protein, partial [Acidimicrobiia bacterium]|nr:WS/DGAT domain-containing protein [Acidimicrobiia bacterium]
MWIVEGLEGDRFALISKTHHCMIDGIAGVDLTTILLNIVPTSEIEDIPPWSPRPAPEGTELAVADLARTAGTLVRGVTSATELARSGKDAVGWVAKRALALTSSLRSGWLRPADQTPLNGEIGPNRRFDWIEIELARIKAVKNALGGSVNDVVLAVVAGAVRHFLTVDHEFAVDEIDFRVMAPVSVRKPNQRGQLGNQVAMWLVTLPVGEADPVKRLRIIEAETKHLKRTDQALGASMLVDISRGTPIPLLSLANRMASNAIRPFNMTVTNVPGPQFPMYLLEARMLCNLPIVPLWAQHGAGIALFSYDGTMFWGVQTDFDTVPDTRGLLDAIDHSFQLLERAAGV